MQLFFEPDISLKNCLNEEDSKHCVRVLRKRKGEIIKIIDGKGGLFDCRIIDDNPKKCLLKIENIESDLPENELEINLYIAPTKNIDRIEWLLEKAVEIGISSFNLIETEHTINKKVNIGRLEKIAISAMKQSLRFYLPKISNSIQKFDKVLINSLIGINLIGHLSENAIEISKARGLNKVNIFIGPEGDFSDKEIKLALENNFKQVSLGKSRLRTETAGLYAIVALNL
jgi:16S rRNA (uracil1498-N3)-methyltransferase